MLDKSQLKPLSTSAKTASEIAKFDQLAEEWRKQDGRFKQISDFNRCRVNAMVAAISDHFELDRNHSAPLTGLKILDIGCGAGLVCEGLAQLGADVTGIDGSAVNIEVAKRNASSQSLAIDYQHCLAEQLATEATAPFDVVLNTEVIEHVDNQKQLTATCAALTKPDGLLVMATINRTIKSFLVAILGAEYILRMLPVGTHDWHWFVAPSQIANWLQQQGFNQHTAIGVKYNPLTKKWRTSKDTSVNYMLFASRH
ncbi:bifunctional 2-polyprenyl-6-hydroxyphenol methylase/3-demethylubiquinol 3-O-methyltransferase UbiG [Neiella sp. HB171785]|uniref:Ubiquinone biosynthesis O-methyltransferase n=1 Tax=Neiella litorisoli TaxID=2771431 RepID=A0A8J6QQ84_9GAMM|nr:bifunctional 2-polyprenyl-6-hydroxyphenol methylase/3-demethylubiquinol 3-O-methyltransferase UbiG [Neiella litorisoli]MBD1389196.1 bifunctional 2-polyprenyl-6-hydroxyphenol methylase/3-demethylubiquinol 3-O-methyltransferase UbiG [Neiella litorisoli]